MQAIMAATPDIVSQLERELLLGLLAPGDKFPSEHALCARFGCSRTPVREALKKLEAAGLLVARHGSGTYVADRSHERVSAAIRRFGATGQGEEAIRELMETRLILETGAVWNAARAAAKDPSCAAPILEAVERMAQLNEKKAALPALAQADADFHLALAKATGNPLTIAIHEALLPALRDHIRRTYADRALFVASEKEHRAIAKAVASGKPERAVAALHAHLGRARREALKLRKEKP